MEPCPCKARRIERPTQIRNSCRKNSSHQVIKRDDPCAKSKKCSSEAQLEFCVELSFFQELIPLLGSEGQFIPASSIEQDHGVTGRLKLRFNQDLSSVKYRLYVFDAIESNNRITAAHLHAGAANVNGPVIAFLYEGAPINVDGLLSEGKLTNADITHVLSPSGFQFNTIASLYAGIREGQVYANVHSELLPAGIIRGQIFYR